MPTALVLPGYKYNMKLTIVPNDEFPNDYLGQKVVRINGKIWMRLNLGATASDPDANPTTSSHHGNYYQWGRKIFIGNGTSNFTTAPTGWSGTRITTANAWNLGTEAIPKKNTENDPCPTGFRVPTKSEMEDLLANTVITRNSGSFTEGASIYNSAFIFTSKRKKSVKLTFPFQGQYTIKGSSNTQNTYSFGGLTSRGLRGYYFNSYFSGTDVNSRLYMTAEYGPTSNTTFVEVQGVHTGNAVESTPIRCIVGN